MPPEGSMSPQPVVNVPLKIGRFKASRMIVSQSWNVLKQDKEIMLFPVLSTIVSIIAFVILGLIFFFVVLGGNIESSQASTTGQNVMSYILVFVYYVVMFFIVNFFQAGIFIIAHGRFNGKDLTFGDGIKGAMSHSGKILVWSIISATVGVILKFISNRLKILGRLIALILGAAWNILTYFSLPALIIGNTSITDSFKQSAALIRKTWGEAVIVNFGVQLFFMLLTFLVCALAIGICFLIPSVYVILAMVLLFIVYIIVISIISSSLNSIFKLALYEYAQTGTVPQGFTPELIKNAIKVK